MTPLVCEWCDAAFVGKSTRRFCGGSCSGKWVASTRLGARAYAAKTVKQFTRVCQWCGAQFWRKHLRTERSRHTKREGCFCSRACGYKGRLIGQSCPIPRALPEKPWLLPRACTECYQFFAPRSRRHIVCGRACALQRGRRKWHETWRSVAETNPTVQHICKECGSEFTTHYYSATRVFCSKRCAKRYWKREVQDKAKIKNLAIGGTGLSLSDFPLMFIKACIAYRRANQEIWRIKHRATDTK